MQVNKNKKILKKIKKVRKIKNFLTFFMNIKDFKYQNNN